MYDGAHCVPSLHELSGAGAFTHLHRGSANAADRAAISINAYRHARHVSTSLVSVIGFLDFLLRHTGEHRGAIIRSKS